MCDSPYSRSFRPRIDHSDLWRRPLPHESHSEAIGSNTPNAFGSGLSTFRQILMVSPSDALSLDPVFHCHTHLQEPRLPIRSRKNTDSETRRKTPRAHEGPLSECGHAIYFRWDIPIKLICTLESTRETERAKWTLSTGKTEASPECIQS